MARKSDLTPQLQTDLINLLSNGVTIADACAYVGITDRTYHNWMAKGEKAKKGDDKYVQFFQAATHARVQARVAAVAIIRKSIMSGDSDDAKWYLERTDPANWGRTNKIIIEGGLDPALINQAIRALLQSGANPAKTFEEIIRLSLNADAGNDNS